MSKKKSKKKKKKQNAGGKIDKLRRSEMNGAKVDLDLVFCTIAKKYRLEKTLIKAMAIVESALDVRAYRHEPMFWDRYLKNNVEWKDKDPKIVSASFGVLQIMFTTAWSLGFRGQAEDLYNPVINVELGTKLMRQLLSNIQIQGIDIKYQIWPIKIMLSRYNGGSVGNPRSDGSLRNQSYVDKVFKVWYNI